MGNGLTTPNYLNCIPSLPSYQNKINGYQQNIKKINVSPSPSLHNSIIAGIEKIQLDNDDSENDNNDDDHVLYSDNDDDSSDSDSEEETDSNETSDESDENVHKQYKTNNRSEQEQIVPESSDIIVGSMRDGQLSVKDKESMRIINAIRKITNDKKVKRSILKAAKKHGIMELVNPLLEGKVNEEDEDRVIDEIVNKCGSFGNKKKKVNTRNQKNASDEDDEEEEEEEDGVKKKEFPILPLIVFFVILSYAQESSNMCVFGKLYKVGTTFFSLS
ncbi:hypothetical protein DLAC_10192 [Tieghemostelium lacteum]|uniref:Uncharacterized protein n=1 Tax=Tieghemostelium lacteum TaxID=361077 RepID=A0A151Z6B8_TIELA|nr:hypothetical protein DLAC_10192 [Tieghemostelium lacteum]|eukprot:KYQ89511.1 hypothetical protein DLAC_10192 [Tieghemostelium lacteum]